MVIWRVAIKAWREADVRGICFLHGEKKIIFNAGGFPAVLLRLKFHKTQLF